ncbi:MAG: DUF2147 domain-containing protein [Pseudomonadales bacterium]|jgi:uncharacterized protein (DUF2147 family)|nr:DUF2147 domain-containing protein [Pseudomonadales bacterium]
MLSLASRTLVGCLLALSVAGVLDARAEAAAALEGCWISAAEDGVIEFRPGDDGALRGRVVGVAEPLFTEGPRRGEPIVDLNNPDVSLRARSIAGIYVVEGLRQNGDAWRGGRLYDPRSGRRFSARARLGEDGMLRIRGYLGMPLLGVTLRWRRATSDPDRTARMIDALAPYRPADMPPPAC